MTEEDEPEDETRWVGAAAKMVLVAGAVVEAVEVMDGPSKRNGTS